MTLTTDGKVAGTTDCNNFFGSYTLASDFFVSFGSLASTKMCCDGSQDAVFTIELQKVSGIRVDMSGNLALILSDVSAMSFVKK